MKRKIIATVSGRVQGVCFRWTTKRVADALNIDGSAVNMRNGSVMVVACGEAKNIEKLIRWLEEGPEAAEVTGLDIQEGESGCAIAAGFCVG